MNNLSEEYSMDDERLVTLARDTLSSCSEHDFSYLSLKKLLDNTINKSVDIIISILHEDIDDTSYQNLVKSIKIIPFRRLAEEIKNFKKESFNNLKSGNYKSENDNSQIQEEKLQIIQESIIKTAKQSKSQRIQSLLNSSDLSKSEISIEKLKSILTIMVQEGEDTAQYRMAKLYFNVLKAFNKNEKIDMSIPTDKLEKLILQTIESIKEKVNKYTEQSLKTSSIQAHTISMLQGQIKDLTKEIQSKTEKQLFEKEIFEDFESSKYNELLDKYEKTFQKIDDMTKSKNELLIRYGSLETQYLVLMQKVNDSIDENNQLKKLIQDFIPDNQ